MKRLAFCFPFATKTGAPIALLRLITRLAGEEGYELHAVLPHRGILGVELQAIATLHVLDEIRPKRTGLLRRVARRLRRSVPRWELPLVTAVREIRPDLIYLNTILYARDIRDLRRALPAIPCIWHIHELGLACRALDVSGVDCSLADLVIANSPETFQFLVNEHGMDPDRAAVIYPVVATDTFERKPNDAPEFRIGCSGTALHRKGAESFVHVAKQFAERYPSVPVRFIWVGDTSQMHGEFETDVARAGLTQIFQFTGPVAEPEEIYATFDVFLSLSKEESFGLAAAEAMQMGVPLVAFEDAGCVGRLASESGGISIPYFDLSGVVDALKDLAENPDTVSAMGKQAAAYAERFGAEHVYPLWEAEIKALLQ